MNLLQKLALAFVDILAVMVGFWLALGLRLDFDWLAMQRFLSNSHLCIYLAVAVFGVVVFYLLGLYEKVWRYAGLYELRAVVCAVAIVAVPVEIAALCVGGALIPRTCAPIAALVWIAMVGGVRLGLRSLAQQRDAYISGPQRRVLIFGANDDGELILRDMLHQKRGWNPIGFIDSKAKRRLRIHGVPVLGGLNDAQSIIAQKQISDVIAAAPPPEELRRLVQICASFENRVRLRLVPRISDVVAGSVKVSRMREVRIEDLLERAPAVIDVEKAAGYLKGKRVLVTGAGGSIGSEICRQAVKLGASSVVLMGRGENSIYEIGVELRTAPVISFIGDLRSRARMEELFRVHRPQVVFHAAAHKHVPLMELSPAEAVSNNVFGVEVLLDMVEKYGAEKLIMISTDKAVNPTSVMGVTKRMGELLMRKRAIPGSAAVRFGNVLGSRGSVIPTFKKQIAAGGPVTVTDPNMTRYFMTIPEAVTLVLEAGSMAHLGEIYILDMGQPVKIIDLARNLIRLSGFEPDIDIPIKVVGLRPGEKMHEELVNTGEETAATEAEKITRVTAPPPGADWPGEHFAELRRACERSDDAECLRLLKILVPQFQHQ